MDAALEAGYEELATELKSLQDRENWVEYALEQINLVQRLAAEIGGLQIHTWPDRELVKATSGEIRFRLSDMRNSISPEHFCEEEPDGLESQAEIAEDTETIRSHIRS